MYKLSKRASHVKHCGCGLSYTREQWDKLPYKFIQDIREYLPKDEQSVPEAILEYRDCPCKSTLAIPVSAEHAAKQVKLHGR